MLCENLKYNKQLLVAGIQTRAPCNKAGAAAAEAADANEARWLAALPTTTRLVARALSSGHLSTSGASIRRGGRGMGPAAAGPVYDVGTSEGVRGRCVACVRVLSPHKGLAH